jgi:hypothetical protein
MAPKAGYPTTMLHVADVERSLLFYALLGYETIDTLGEPPGWARLHCEGGAIMLLLAEVPLDPGRKAVPIYMYTPDLRGLREHLVANGVTPSAISHPEYMKSGEMCVEDPDGHVIFVGHWGREEHAEWERHLAERKARLAGQ